MTVLADLIRFTTATTGAGTLTVGSAVAPFMTPATYGAPFNSGTTAVFYSIIDTAGGNSETGTGTYNASGATLTRTPITSTNSNAAISLSGSAQVMFTAIASAIVNKTGDTMTGNLILNADPSQALGAATKQYVDNTAAALNPATAVSVATTTAANTSGLTYNNGASGVGATFTGSNNTAITWDGFTFTAVGQRGLVKNDTQSPSGAFNGVYMMTQVQTSITPPILTRATDYNQPSDINSTGSIPVINGTVNASTSWLITSNVTTVGTSPLTYTQFTLAPTSVLQVANNLSDVASAATSRTNIGLTTPLSPTIGGLGIANNSANTVTFSGSYATTFTLTGTTAVTFPTAGTLAILGANTFTGTQTIPGSSSVLAALITNVAEPATVSATAATGTINFYFATQSVLFYTSNASGTWTMNFSFSAGTTLDSVLATGQAITGVFAVTQGSTAHFGSAIQVDGNASGSGGYTITVNWQGGTAPTTGNASGIDIYGYTLVKTGTKTYQVFASQAQF